MIRSSRFLFVCAPILVLSGLIGLQTQAAPKKTKADKAKAVQIPANVEMLPVTRRDREFRHLRLLPPTNSRAGQRMTAAGLDRLMVEEFIREGLTRAKPKVADDVFFRRVHLALVGKLPSPDEISAYLADTREDKKARLIDDLLNRQEFGRNQARYWRDVIDYHLPDADVRVPSEPFEEWLATQFNENKPWAQIAGEILTAKGTNYDSPATYMIVAHNGDPVQLAGETSRIFLGVQIQCAECHDHPSDTWKRRQFHELAAFFGRVRVKNRQDLQTKERRFVREVYEVKGQYRMPDLMDPSAEGESMEPVFLTGQAIPDIATDQERRYVLGRLLTSQRNEYFARAFVNRVWAQLFGYGFTNPVDNISPEAPVAYPRVFDALADSFRTTGYDVKELYRVILNTKSYERRFEEIDGSFGEDVMFAAIQPSHLTADQIYDNLEAVLGRFDRGNSRGLRDEFHRAFGFDPSSNREERQGSILQALLLMNNPVVHGMINAADPKNLLHFVLSEHPQDDAAAIERIYLYVLARKPRSNELEDCLAFLKEVPDRAEGFEDILWCLLNTTEFLHNQ
jgi:hypothetical protein